MSEERTQHESECLVEFKPSVQHLKVNTSVFTKKAIHAMALSAVMFTATKSPGPRKSLEILTNKDVKSLAEAREYIFSG